LKKRKVGVRAHLDESTNDAEGGEAQVLKWTCFRSCVQERVQEEGYMGVQEELSCLGMRCDTLEEREGIANAVRYMRCQVRWREHWIDGHNLLEEGWHDTWCAVRQNATRRRRFAKGWLTECVPQNEGEVVVLLALFGELEEGGLSRFRVQEVYDEAIDVVLVVGDG